MLFPPLIWTIIRHWKETARDLLRDLEAWRQDPGVYCEQHAGYNGKRKRIVPGFRFNTDRLIREAENLSLDPRPLQAFSDAVDSWNYQHDDQVPDQERLSAMFDAALAILLEIENGVRRRMVKERPIQGAQSLAPVAVNGRQHTANGVVTAPAVTKAPEPVFVPTGLQEAMLDALDGVALRTSAWVKRSGVGKRTLMKLKPELQERGLVKHHKRLGFYRPDAPPPELVGT